ncbi:MAG TPA: TetR family transcriptional regulator, partial [Sphingobacterium sp.]|nr:TetR family transcriptional regulator [Sphingobacterium sp.]
LISINLVNQGNGDNTNQEVLKDAIYGITRSLTD